MKKLGSIIRAIAAFVLMAVVGSALFYGFHKAPQASDSAEVTAWIILGVFVAVGLGAGWYELNNSD